MWAFLTLESSSVRNPGPGILRLPRTEKIVGESFCWLLFTLCELKECRRLCSKTLFMRTTKPGFPFLGKYIQTRQGSRHYHCQSSVNLLIRILKLWCLYNIFAWYGIVRKFPPLLTASLLLLLPNWGVEVRSHGNRTEGANLETLALKPGTF